MAPDQAEQKADLHRYLRRQREAMVWKLEGLSEYDIRRPMTRTGTNLLGLVKHVGTVGGEYFGAVFDRPGPTAPWAAPDAADDADLWATADESRAAVLEFWERAWAHADTTIEEFDLDAPGFVPWWSPELREVTLHRVLTHMISESARHAGHADILRELIDGAAGVRAEHDNLTGEADDDAHWQAYRDKLENIARTVGDG